jgi:phosphatidylglycerol:prolipoprotein diacylglycerol transferase
MFTGSKIYHFFEIWDEVILNPAENLFSISGWGWYGGFIFGTISIVLLLRFKKLPILGTFDIIAPVIPLGQAIGRVGCFLSGCCHGIPSKVPWAVSFPYGQFPTYVKVHPTQLYETLIYLSIFILLWSVRKKELERGLKFSLYLISAGLGRFMVEFYRLNSQVLFRLTVPQIIAMMSITIGVFIIMNTCAINDRVNSRCP